MKQLTQEQLKQVYREHPEWLTEIEVGKWYKVKDHKTLFFVTNIATIVTADGFGFNSLGFWCNDGLWSTAHVVEAKPFEVEAALIAEARKRGFKSSRIEMIGNTLTVGVGSKWKVIFMDGKWAAVITPASNLAEDIQALKDKYPNYNWTIIAEEKQ